MRLKLGNALCVIDKLLVAQLYLRPGIVVVEWCWLWCWLVMVVELVGVACVVLVGVGLMVLVLIEPWCSSR